MSEQAEQTTAAANVEMTPAQPAAQAMPQGGQGQQPSGRYVSDEEYNRYRRAEDQARGMAQFHTKATQFGFKTPEDFDKYSPVFSLINERKIDPAMLANALSGGGQKPEAGDEKLSPEEMEERLWLRFQERQAEDEHQQQMGRLHEIVSDQLKGLFGDEAVDEQELELYRMAALGRIVEDRRTNATRYSYPEGHRLHGKRYAPPNAENAKHIWDWVKEHRTKRQGATLAGIGDAANKAPKHSTPAGQKSTAGTGGKPDPLGDAHRRMEAMAFEGIPA
jgi:hypothetical protein